MKHRSKDATTLGFYATEAGTYATHRAARSNPVLEGFMARLPAGASVLELGCGGGQDSSVLIDHGYQVTPTDGSPELAAEASKRLGLPVKVMLFEDIDLSSEFDGVWANACLLHVPRIALPDILSRIWRSLKPGGLFYASFKAGTAEGRDSFNRYYNYPDPDWLRSAYNQASWQTVEISERQGSGYGKLPTRWLDVFAVKDTKL